MVISDQRVDYNHLQIRNSSDETFVSKFKLLFLNGKEIVEKNSFLLKNGDEITLINDHDEEKKVAYIFVS